MSQVRNSNRIVATLKKTWANLASTFSILRPATTDKHWRLWATARNDREAVKRGWSWPATCFGLFWLFYKRMWFALFYISLFILLIVTIWLLLQYRNYEWNGGSDIIGNNFDFLEQILLVGTLVINGLLGKYGNRWYEAHLQRQRYKPLARLCAAPSRHYALQKFPERTQESTKSQTFEVAEPEPVGQESSSQNAMVIADEPTATITSLDETFVDDSEFIEKDEKYYEQAWHELQSGDLKPGLWAKAFAKHPTNERTASASYIDMRVEQLRTRKDEADLVEPAANRPVVSHSVSIMKPSVIDALNDLENDDTAVVTMSALSMNTEQAHLRVDSVENAEEQNVRQRGIFDTDACEDGVLTPDMSQLIVNGSEVSLSVHQNGISAVSNSRSSLKDKFTDEIHVSEQAIEVSGKPAVGTGLNGTGSNGVGSDGIRIEDTAGVLNLDAIKIDVTDFNTTDPVRDADGMNGTETAVPNGVELNGTSLPFDESVSAMVDQSAQTKTAGRSVASNETVEIDTAESGVAESDLAESDNSSAILNGYHAYEFVGRRSDDRIIADEAIVGIHSSKILKLDFQEKAVFHRRKRQLESIRNLIVDAQTSEDELTKSGVSSMLVLADCELVESKNQLHLLDWEGVRTPVKSLAGIVDAIDRVLWLHYQTR